MTGLGWHRDPAKRPGEKPDRDAAHLLGSTPIPARASARENILSVLDQGMHESCVANAGMQAIRASQWRQKFTKVVLGSRWWGYYLARAQHGATHQDAGTFIRMFFDGCAKFGFPSEEIWPYDEAILAGLPRWATMPASEAFMGAFDQRQQSTLAYHRIGDTDVQRVLQVQRAIAQGRCVVFGGPVNQDYVSGHFDATVPYDPSQGELAGGHAQCLVAYNPQGAQVVNSWSETWGDGGYAWLTWDYLASDQCGDFWIADTAPAFSA